MHIEIDIEAFETWLCFHESDIVGTPGMWFHSPLAIWLSEMYGHIYGVDTRCYGRASSESTQWRWLPTWAQHLQSHLTCHELHAITGEVAFAALAEVEQTLLPIGSPF